MRTARTLFYCCLACAALVIATPRSLADPGILDSTFSEDGWLARSFGRAVVANAVAIQTDGKIVIAGTVTTRYDGRDEGKNILVARFDENGAPDLTFSRDGVVSTHLGGNENALDVVATPHGQIVIAGRRGTTTGRDFLLVRYRGDGTRDTSFGQQGVVMERFPRSRGQQANALSVLPDGGIIAVGETRGLGGSGWAIARFRPTGALDDRFSGDGMLEVDRRGPDLATDVSVTPDERFTVTGSVDHTDFAAMRLLANGARDDSFSGNGFVKTDFGDQHDFSTSSVLLENGSLVLAGLAVRGPQDWGVGLVRYLDKGSLDRSFGENGRVVATVDPMDLANAITVDPEGRLVVAGITGGDAGGEGSVGNERGLVMRFHPSGDLDLGFGESGSSQFDRDGWQSFNDVAIDSDGRIVVVGSTGRRLVVARYLAE